MQEPPIEDLLAGDTFRKGLIARADGYDGPCPLWHGWAIMDAFLAGAEFARKQAMTDRSEWEPLETLTVYPLAKVWVWNGKEVWRCRSDHAHAPGNGVTHWQDIDEPAPPIAAALSEQP